jgi:hypothetical protein
MRRSTDHRIPSTPHGDDELPLAALLLPVPVILVVLYWLAVGGGWILAARLRARRAGFDLHGAVQLAGELRLTRWAAVLFLPPALFWLLLKALHS